MEKEFVPYELAVKLKELGFKEKCFAKFKSGSFHFNVLGKPIDHNTEQIVPGDVSAPLWQQAFEFFRERGYNIITDIRPSVGAIPKSYLASLHHDDYTTELLPSCGSRSFESKLKYSITAVYKIEDYMDLIELTPPENKRTYYYKDGSSVSFSGITHFKASMTTHRLKLNTGILIIVPVEDLKYIEISCDNFTI